MIRQITILSILVQIILVQNPTVYVSGSQLQTRSVSVKGELKCGSQPARNYKLRVVSTKKPISEEPFDSQSFVLVNEEINEISSRTDKLLVNARIDESNFANQKFLVVINHNCDDDMKKKGERRFWFKVPDQYMATSAWARKDIFDMGILNLQMVYPGEDRDMRMANETTATVVNQAVSVKGVLMCGAQPLTNGKVKLFSKFSEKTEAANEIDRTDMDSMGQFEVEGFVPRQGAGTNFEPNIKIYHKCDESDTGKKKKKKGETMYRVVSVKIPKIYISDGRRSTNIFNIGRLNLEPGYAGEIRESVPDTVGDRELAADVFKQLFFF